VPTSASNVSPLVVLDGTKLISRVHIGAAVRRAMALNNTNSAGFGATTTTAAPAPAPAAASAAAGKSTSIDGSRTLSPTRLQSPSRRRSDALHEEQQQQQNGASVARAAGKPPVSRIASQLVYALSPSRSTAIRNFALQSPPAGTADAGSYVHSSAVVVFDADVQPAEAWRWVKAAGAMEMTVSLDTLQATLNADAVCQIYGLEGGVSVPASGAGAGVPPAAGRATSPSRRSAADPAGQQRDAARQTGHAVQQNSNMPGRVAVRDVSWLERQVVSRVATNGL
jgi:hypothetical protein